MALSGTSEAHKAIQLDELYHSSCYPESYVVILGHKSVAEARPLSVQF